MAGQFFIAPLLPIAWIGVTAVILFAAVLFGARLGLTGWPMRLAAALFGILALLNPSYLFEEREQLPDVVLAVVDRSASQSLSDRVSQTDTALAAIERQITAMANTELVVAEVTDGADNSGTLLAEEVRRGLADIPANQLAGVLLLSDGVVHQTDPFPDISAPVHLLRTGRGGDWDRRLVIENAPVFAVVDESVSFAVRIEDQGAVPDDLAKDAIVGISVDGSEENFYRMPVGQTVELTLTPDHAGANIIQFATDILAGELTGRNNSAVMQVNGVRDRLRVLLVSGEPHAGERTWRNLLKSDLSVDLVHFTILRPPDKRDGVPVTELALIAFPTRELFVEKIDEFDLIIFDRYQLRGILPSAYLQNVQNYVAEGGAVLIAAGPEFSSAGSIYHSALADIIPVTPTGFVEEGGFRPTLTDIGKRHPLTADLSDGQDEADWGRWFRYIDVKNNGGDVLMTGPDSKPLLVTSRVGDGRLSVLASDHAWLWSRDFEGGGPQGELLRRLAHWMMQEPDLEEEAMSGTLDGDELVVTHRTLQDDPGPLTITGPDGTDVTLDMEKTGEGRFVARQVIDELGLYRLATRDLSQIVAVGPVTPIEFANTIATDQHLLPVVEASGGGSRRIEDGFPTLRRITTGSRLEGRGWLGIKAQFAYRVLETRQQSLLPGWAYLIAISGLILWGWLREGRR